jgi:hypothetical protein
MGYITGSGTTIVMEILRDQTNQVCYVVHNRIKEEQSHVAPNS